MSPQATQLDNVAETLIAYDRINMFSLYAKNKRTLKMLKKRIMQYGAIRIMRHAYQRRIRQFHLHAREATFNENMQCLQALAENEPEYSGADDQVIYCGAVLSDNVDIVKYVTEKWPLSLNCMLPEAREYGIPELAAKVAAGWYAKSAKMAEHLLDSWRGPGRQAIITMLFHSALVDDSVEIIKIVMKDELFDASRIPAIYAANADDERLSKNRAIYRYMESEGVFGPAG